VTWVALRMLVGDWGKYLGLVLGITMAAFLMSQQLSIFIGAIRRCVSVIEDVDADVWVVSHETEQLDYTRPLPRGVLQLVRGVAGVRWAAPFHRGTALVTLETGRFRNMILLGVDDASLAGAPAQMLVGSAEDLRRPDAVIVDSAGHKYLWPGEEFRPGRVMHVNERRLELVGVCRASVPFVSHPVFYTRYSVARDCLAIKHDRISYVLVKAEDGRSPEALCRRIAEQTGCLALTREEFMWKTAWYVIRYTGIAPNFAITIALGFVVGAAISGQLFHLFVLEHMRHFGSLMAMGVRGGTVARMVLLQTAVVSCQGVCLGLGLASLFFTLGSRTTSLAGLYLYWQAAGLTTAAMLLFMGAVGLLAVRRLLALEPAASICA
jgi:putative ABC transport system permease protein